MKYVTKTHIAFNIFLWPAIATVTYCTYAGYTMLGIVSATCSLLAIPSFFRDYIETLRIATKLDSVP